MQMVKSGVAGGVAAQWNTRIRYSVPTMSPVALRTSTPPALTTSRQTMGVPSQEPESSWITASKEGLPATRIEWAAFVAVNRYQTSSSGVAPKPSHDTVPGVLCVAPDTVPDTGVHAPSGKSSIAPTQSSLAGCASRMLGMAKQAATATCLSNETFMVR